MPAETLKAIQWNTKDVDPKKVVQTLERFRGVDIIALQSLSGQNANDNQAKDIAAKLNLNHQFFPDPERENGGVALLAPRTNELCFPETYQADGLMRSIKAELLHGFGQPIITVVSADIDPNQSLTGKIQSIEQQQEKQRRIRQGLRPKDSDKDYYLVLATFGVPQKHLQNPDSQYLRAIPQELTEGPTTSPRRETKDHALYVNWRLQQLGLIHIRTDLDDVSRVNPLLKVEFRVQLPERNFVPVSPTQSLSSEELRPIMLYPRQKPHHSS